jgi:hypothetical protein
MTADHPAESFLTVGIDRSQLLQQMIERKIKWLHLEIKL